jgi:ligand-binding sensor domain-containing protein/signal transduction histidine kinase
VNYLLLNLKSFNQQLSCHKPLKNYLFLIVIAFIWPCKTSGQTYSFTHYQVENGLSNNAALCSMQDKNGFMWIGTKDGLNRFDGYSFKIFRNDPNNPKSLGNNIIYCLLQDGKGTIWIGTDHGIYTYDDRTESFTFLKESTENEIRDIKEDTKGNIWFISGIVLCKYSPSTRRVKIYDHMGLNAVSLAFVKGTLWISTTARLIEKYSEGTDTFTAYDIFKHSAPATAYWIQKLYDAGNGQLLVGTSNQGVKIFNTADNDYKDAICRNTDNTEIFVRDFIKHNKDEYWVATESGIYILNIKTGKSTLLHKQYNDPYSLSDNAVYTFCKDREGGIWAGTYFGGLNYAAKQYTFFEKSFPKVGENSLSGNAVREICPDDNGNLWIGTEDGGLNKYSPKTRQFINYKPLGRPSDISASNIHGLLTYNNQLLIGTFEHGLDVMDIRTGRITNHHTVFTDTIIKSNFFYALYKNNSGAIFAGTSRGLYYYNAEKQSFGVFDKVSPYLFYTTIFEDNTGTLWAGSYRDGLFFYDNKTGASGGFKYNSSDVTSLSNNKINWIFQDSNHGLWFATEEGLCKINADRKSFRRYTIASGLPSNVIYTVLEDSKKKLWITTSKGLVCMNLTTQQITVYTKANGLLSDQFNYNSAYKDAVGNMYFGCVKGMIKFNPDSFASNQFQPPVFITGFQINNQDIAINKDGSPLERSITFTDTVTLNHNQSSFSIDFAALSYTSPQTASYAYKMDGLDKEWIYLSTNRKVYFTRLSAGTYTFNVKASNSSGLWSNHTARLTIIIKPPFWASIYAYLVYLGLFACLIYYLVHNYHYRINEKNRRKIDMLENEKQKEIYHAKIAFFTHVAHEIRTPLTLIKGPMEKVMKKAAQLPDVKKNLIIMERNTERLLVLTNQLLDFRKTETHGFSLSFVKTDVNLLIREVLLRFRSAIDQKGIHIELNLPTSAMRAYVDTEAMNKILSNLLDNALKYANTKITITLTEDKSNNTFTIILKNDGQLIPFEMKDKVFETFFRMKEAEKQSGTGIGLPLSRYLAELHKGSLTLQPSQDSLNVFVLMLPIHQDIEFNI